VKSILPGGRGPAVEDIQRRLLRLGFDLGPTGVDGVFLGRTQDAVKAFQTAEGLGEDGIVGDETWSALVDATFTMGDRSLYLRLPHFHGVDVRVLQSALNTLGFWCGEPDGIFGPYSERAAREFQRSCGQIADGIVGLDSVRALVSLRHVWEGKDSDAPSTATATKARATEALTRVLIRIEATDVQAEDVARRLVNLALASQPDARMILSVEDDELAVDALDLVLSVHGGLPDGVPVVEVGEDSAATGARLMTALAVSGDECGRIGLELGELAVSDELQQQRVAVVLLDSVCVALA